MSESNIKNIMVSMESEFFTMKTFENLMPSNFFSLIQGFSALGQDAIESFLPTSRERAFKDANRNSKQVRFKLVNMENIDLSRIRFMTPERLTGSMLSTMVDLIRGYVTIKDNLGEVILSLQNDIALAMSDDLDDMRSPRSFVEATKLKKTREDLQKAINSNFKATKVTSYGLASTHFKTIENVQNFYGKLAPLEIVINSKDWDRLVESTGKLNEEIIGFTEYLQTQEQKRYKSRAVKELSESFYEVAKAYEFIGYVQAKTLQMFKSTESLTSAILQYGK